MRQTIDLLILDFSKAFDTVRLILVCGDILSAMSFT
jgi:hypothetical protein